MTAEAYRQWIGTKLTIGSEILYLTQQEVRELPLSHQDCFDLTKRSLIAYSNKQVDMPAKIGIHPLPETFYHAMPCYVPEIHAAGIKWGSCYPENPQKYGYSQANGLIIYNDSLSGAPIGILDCIYVTEKRTAAVSYVAAYHLADPSTTTFGMIGCGVEGTQHVRGICNVLPNLKTIYIYDIYESAMDKLIAALQPTTPAKIVKAASFEEIAKQSQVLCSATIITEQPEPKIKDEWIGAGQTLILCDCHSLFEDATMKRADKYLLDSIEQHQLLIGYGYYPDGLPTVYAETGQVAGGSKPGRESASELIVCNNVGMAVEDMYLVRHLFDQALEQGIGRLLPL